MNIVKRRNLGATALFFLSGVSSIAAEVTNYLNWPNKPIRIVVVYPPGGGIDLIARHLGKKLADLWGVPVVIDNRPGAGTTLGTSFVSKSNADGYTLLMTDVSFAIAPGLYKNLPYNAQQDFAPITLLNTVDDILVVNPEVPAKNIRELINIARANPNALMYASAGNGTLNHLAPEMLKQLAGIHMLHVPYKGALAALNDLMAGQVQVYIGALASVLPFIKSGRLKAIAVTGSRRSDALPDIPTVAESGVPGYEVSSWYGLFAPAGSPAKVVEIIQREIFRLSQEPEFRRNMIADGNEVVAGTSREFSSFLERDLAKWRKAVLAAGAKVD